VTDVWLSREMGKYLTTHATSEDPERQLVVDAGRIRIAIDAHVASPSNNTAENARHIVCGVQARRAR
jgi:hypothetical protein